MKQVRWALVILVALAAVWPAARPGAAASIRQQAGELTIAVTGARAEGSQVDYELRVMDAGGQPVPGAAATLKAQLPGAVYATSGAGLSGLASADFQPGSEPGVYRATVQYPARGIWQVWLQVQAGGSETEINFAENVGDVWSDRNRGLTMLGAVSAGVTLWVGLGFWRRRRSRIGEVES